MLFSMLLSAWIPFLVSSPAEVALQRAINSRENIRTGTVIYREVCTLAGDMTECEATATFDEAHFRVDVQDHSAFRSASNKSSIQRFDPLRMAFNGNVVLDRMIQLDVATFRVSELHGTRIPFNNARLLGLPGTPDSRVSVSACLRAGNEVTSYSKDGSLHRVTITTSVSAKPPRATLRLVIDESRGWSVIEYVYEGVEVGGSRFRVFCEVTPSQFDDVWFPVLVHKESWTDGTLRTTQDIGVSDATFNAKLPEDAFTWEGIGIADGAIIQSSVPAIGTTFYRSAGKHRKPTQEQPAVNPGDAGAGPR